MGFLVVQYSKVLQSVQQVSLAVALFCHRVVATLQLVRSPSVHVLLMSHQQSSSKRL